MRWEMWDGGSGVSGRRGQWHLYLLEGGIGRDEGRGLWKRLRGGGWRGCSTVLSNC